MEKEPVEHKFDEVPFDVVGKFLDVMQDFPLASNFSFKVLFRTTMKKSRGRVCLAYICLPSDLAKYFSQDEENPKGYDFVLVLDKNVWEIAEEKDRERIIRHELCHVAETKSGNPAMVDHDVQDFYSEMVRNVDCPDWGRRLAEILVAKYDQDKEAKKK